MGYTTVKEMNGAISAAAALAGRVYDDGPELDADAVAAALPMLVDQIQAEAGVYEPRVCARAAVQARGDIARAVSLVRAWAATLPRAGSATVTLAQAPAERRITPAFRESPGGQYLGASLDYAPRLLDLDETPDPVAGAESAPDDVDGDGDGFDGAFPRALRELEAEGLVDPGPRAQPLDRTREAVETGADRGAFQQLLARAETGALTALAYTAIRGPAGRQDPTLAELRVGEAQVELEHPDGGTMTVGSVTLTSAEIAGYRIHDETADRRLTLGVGASFGRLERRAISAALLDAGAVRARADAAGHLEPCDDEEFLTIALDGQEATGFLEHLKLPHYVTFTSDLDRILSAAREPAEAIS